MEKASISGGLRRSGGKRRTKRMLSSAFISFLMASARPSAAAHDADEDALDVDVLGRVAAGLKLGVVGDEPHALRIAPELLEGDLLLIDEGHHTVAVPIFTLALQHHQIAVEDGVVHHGIAPDAQHEEFIP